MGSPGKCLRERDRGGGLREGNPTLSGIFVKNKRNFQCKVRGGSSETESFASVELLLTYLFIRSFFIHVLSQELDCSKTTNAYLSYSPRK